MTPDNQKQTAEAFKICPQCSDLEEGFIVHCPRHEDMIVGDSYKLRDGRTGVYLAKWRKRYMFGVTNRTDFYDTNNLHGIKLVERVALSAAKPDALETAVKREIKTLRGIASLIDDRNKAGQLKDISDAMRVSALRLERAALINAGASE